MDTTAMQSLYDLIRRQFEETPLEAHKHFLPPDPHSLMEQFRWLLACGLLICPEYRFTWPSLNWWKDEEFNAYLKKFGELQDMNAYRRWNLGQFLRMVEEVPGDTVECGVYKGASSWLICRANARQGGRIHHIFDSFEGLSEPLPLDGTHWKKNALASGEETLRENLQEFADACRVYKGWIPERFDEVKDRRFAFVHVDVDLYEPTRDSLEFFYPRLNKGAILVCDDYGFTNNPGANKAVDDFMRDKPEKVILPSAGGCWFSKQ